MKKLTYKQSENLRKLYGSYKSLDRRDFINHESYAKEHSDILTEIEAILAESGNGDIQINSLPKLIYSENQLQFIKDAEIAKEENSDVKLRYDYSGRGMYGDVCPALYCDSINDITTTARKVMDSMGRGIVIYAQY